MIGVGVDLVKVDRIEKALEKSGGRFARRILSESEVLEFENSRDPATFLAKRFAIKEAVAKALGTGFSQGVSWKDITLFHNDLGRPEVKLAGGAEKVFVDCGASKTLVSLSDDAGMVIAHAYIS